MRAALTFAAVAVVVLAQATAVDRLPLDWAAGPDLVVVAVVATALTGGTAAAAGCGFAAGLALDALPPAEPALGTHALLLCLTGYTVSLLRHNLGAPGAFGGRVPVWTALGASTLAALGTGLALAAAGLLTGDPRVDPPGAATTVASGTLATALASPLVALPILWVRSRLTEAGLATVQGPAAPRGWGPPWRG